MFCVCLGDDTCLTPKVRQYTTLSTSYAACGGKWYDVDVFSAGAGVPEAELQRDSEAILWIIDTVKGQKLGTL